MKPCLVDPFSCSWLALISMVAHFRDGILSQLSFLGVSFRLC